KIVFGEIACCAILIVFFVPVGMHWCLEWKRFEFLFGNYIQCENEHIACHSCCSSSSSKCKSCAPSASFKRCQILEKIIQSLGGSCKYLKYGPCSCPIEGCNYYGPLMQLSMHLSGQHRDSITCFRYNKLYSITLRYDERFCVLQEMSDGDIFLVDNVEHDIGNMVSVSRIGPYTFISPFSIELKIEAVKWVHWDQLSLRLSCKIESIRSRVGYQPSTRDFLLVPSGYFEGGEEFELLFRISRADV
ncbi:E3 ubiquitin-protein ligase SINA-like 10, partial [Morus notabilis]